MNRLGHAGHDFFESLAGEFHVGEVGAHIYVFVPGYGSVWAYMDLLEVTGFVPRFEYTLSGEVGEVNLARFAVFVLYPDFVSGQGLDLCRPKQCVISFLIQLRSLLLKRYNWGNRYVNVSEQVEVALRTEYVIFLDTDSGEDRRCFNSIVRRGMSGGPSCEGQCTVRYSERWSELRAQITRFTLPVEWRLWRLCVQERLGSHPYWYRVEFCFC